MILGVAWDGGLRPSPDQARTWAEQELTGTGYGRPAIGRFLSWLGDLLGRFLSPAPTTSGGTGLPSLPAAALAVVLAALAVVLILRVRRERRSVGSARDPKEPGPPRVFGADMLAAEEYRRRARAALDVGDAGAAALDAFRAAAAQSVERRVIAAARDRTAGEFAAAMAAGFPELAWAARSAARTFDEARYGGLVPDLAAARAVLDLDEQMRRRTPEPIDPASLPRPLAVPR